MRPFLIACGLLGVVAVSVAFGGGASEPPSVTDLATRVGVLTKELESLKSLPKQIAELKEEIRAQAADRLEPGAARHDAGSVRHSEECSPERDQRRHVLFHSRGLKLAGEDPPSGANQAAVIESRGPSNGPPDRPAFFNRQSNNGLRSKLLTASPQLPPPECPSSAAGHRCAGPRS
jgi:hypothetical protein